jgi:BolA protein
MNTITDRVAIITSRLEQAFSPSQLTVLDESDQHIGHAGHQGGGRHFAIYIAADRFKSLTRVAAHREIYALFSDMMPDTIHALRIHIQNG